MNNLFFFLVIEDQELYPRLDTDFLIRFIRVRKYNVDTAARTVKNYYRNRAATTSTPNSLLPSSIKSHVRSLVMVLPQRDVHGRLVLLVRLGERFPLEFASSTLTVGSGTMYQPESILLHRFLLSHLVRKWTGSNIIVMQEIN